MIRFQRLYIHRMGVNIFYRYAWVIEFWSDLLIKSNIYRVLSLWYLDLTSTSTKSYLNQFAVCITYQHWYYIIVVLLLNCLQWCANWLGCIILILVIVECTRCQVKWITFYKNWVTIERASKVGTGLQSWGSFPTLVEVFKWCGWW